MKTTDTLRTDACPYCGSIENDTEGNLTWYVCGTYHAKGYDPARSSLCCDIEERTTIARQLKRELTISLKNQFKNESDLLQSQDINSFLDTEFRIACKRAEKSEAEVDRLRENAQRIGVNRYQEISTLQSQLKRAVEIAEKIWADSSNGSEHTELAALKGEIN